MRQTSSCVSREEKNSGKCLMIQEPQGIRENVWGAAALPWLLWKLFYPPHALKLHLHLWVFPASKTLRPLSAMSLSTHLWAGLSSGYMLLRLGKSKGVTLRKNGDPSAIGETPLDIWSHSSGVNLRKSSFGQLKYDSVDFDSVHCKLCHNPFLGGKMKWMSPSQHIVLFREISVVWLCVCIFSFCMEASMQMFFFLGL